MMTELLVKHAVEQVTVYPDRARVTNRATVELVNGTTALLFDDLPLSMETESVRFGGSGAGVRILGIDVARVNYEETPSAAVGELMTQKETLAAELRALADEQVVLQSEAAYIEGLRLETNAFAKGLSRGKTTVDDQLRLLAFLQDRDRDVRQAQRDLLPQVETLQRKLEKVERDLAEVRSQRSRQRYQARIEVQVAEAGTFMAELSCVVTNASWRPLYDVRLVEQEGHGRVLTVSTFAEVRQQTGQDWNGVELTVSTARPALNQRLPELEPWFLDKYEPPTERMLMAYSADMMEPGALNAAPQSGRGRPAMAKQADYAVAEAQQTGAVLTYRVQGESTVESDGAPHKNLLARFEARPQLTYLAIPRHTTAVYRRATFANETAAPLLAGHANLFVDEEYIGRTGIEYTPQGDKLELLLGVEERITVERELVRRQVDKRLLREDRVLHYAYVIKLKNLLAEPVPVEVQDQIPVSRHESIKVKLDQVTPAPQTQTEMQIMTWQLDMDAGSERTIRYEFAIEHPRALELAGLQE
jgi:uncharacterized protein (TIGR02231 family)